MEKVFAPAVQYAKYMKRLKITEKVLIKKTITYKETGEVSTKPDYVVLSMSLESQNQNYDAAMSQEEEKFAQLNETLVSAEFEEGIMKTTKFNIDTDCECVQDRSGNQHRVFNGYVIKQILKVSFDLDSKRLAQALSAVGRCLSKPKLSVSFTVKDENAVKEEMLCSIAENARQTAEILCKASGVKLGELLGFNYDWEEVDFYSHTKYEIAEECQRVCKPLGMNIRRTILI